MCYPKFETLMIHECKIKIQVNNAIEAKKAEENLQVMAEKIGAAKINKLMDMYKNPIKKLAVDTFLATL